MSRAIFIDQTYFYENTEVDENVNWKLIRSTIWNAQEFYIQEILGSPLYDALKDEIIANTGPLTTARFVTLVNTYVVPCLINYVMSDVQVPLLYKFRNKAVSTDRSDYSDPVDFKEHRYLKDFYQLRAEKYAEKITRYLCANSSTFPEWTTYTSSDQVRAKDPKPTTSVYMGGARSASKGYGWEYYEKNG